MQTATGGERRKENVVAKVCRDGGDEGMLHSPLEMESFGDSANVMDYIPMLDAHPFWLTGRAARINDVGEMLGRHPDVGRHGARAAPIERIKANGRRDRMRPGFPEPGFGLAGSVDAVRRTVGWASSRTKLTRAVGCRASIGRYAPPALRIARIPTTISNERGTWSATRTSGPMPGSTSRIASASARRFNSV